MELGDRVTAYTHEASDLGPDVVRDELAFVTGFVDEEEKCIDVVIFPSGGPVRFERLCVYDPDYLYNTPGGRYYRPGDEDAPNFDETMPYSSDPEWNALVARQVGERNRALTQQERDALVDRHTKERDELNKRLDERAKGSEAQAPTKPKKEGRR